MFRRALYSILRRIGLAQPSFKLVLLGLDAAGKTTMLYSMQGALRNSGEIKCTIPTIGWNVETVQVHQLSDELEWVRHYH